MAGSPLEMLLRHLTGWTEGGALAECSDGQLLERFVTHCEEAAFTSMLRRHGPMVLSVCRRALANEQDREDVFQATFLLLVQKAGSIRRRESVGSWLHGVAHRLAVRCRAQKDRRRVHERQAGLERTSAAPAPEAWEELRTQLDEAIAELPEKYRSALVLCYLEDHTHEEAARRLGCRLTTLRSRVARGRERLRIALLQRGLALSSAAFLAALATSAAQAALPASLRTRTLTAALQFAKGVAASGLVSASTAALVEGGLQTVSTVKMRVILASLLLSGLTLGGAGLLAHQIFGVKIPEEPPQASGERAAVPPPENKPQPAVDRFGDPLPERAVARLGTVPFRMGGLVLACAWSPDGETLAAGSAKQGNDNTICLFDAATGKPIQQLGGRQFEVTSLAFSPDGRTLASGSSTGITLWNLATGKMLRQFRSMTSQCVFVWSLTFTPDGKGLISAGEGPWVQLWDPATGRPIREFKGHKELVGYAVLSPDGQTLASADDKEIRLWEMATGKLLRRLTGQKEPIRALAFSPDCKLLASGSDDHSINSIWLWETTTGKIHRPLPEEHKVSKSCVRSLAFSPDGKMLAAGYRDYTFRSWDMATGKKLHETPGVPSIITDRAIWGHFGDGGIQCVVFSRDGKKLVLARENQLILLDAASGKEISNDLLTVGAAPAAESGDLRVAVIKGDVARVKDLLAAGHAVNAKDKDGYTPLFWAAFCGHADIANLLLAKGADVNAKNISGITPLYEASYRGHRKVVELLLAAGADVNARGEKGQTPLHAAVDRGNPAVVEVLLKDKHINVNAHDDHDFRPLDYVMARLWQKYKDETVKQAQDRVRRQVALAKLLIEDKKIDLNTPQKSGGAPLHYVARAGNLELASLLLAKGAQVNVRDHSPPFRRPLPSGNTPLHWAIKADQSDMAKFLLEHGADPNAKNSEGETPSDLQKGKKSG